MTTKKNAASINRAAPAIRKPKKTDVEKVQCTQTMTTAMQASASWAAATDVQGAVKIWNTSASDIDANSKVIAQLKDQLAAGESKQRTLRRSWQAATAQVLSTVNVFCAGSADLVKGFNFDVRLHAALGAQAAVASLTVSTGKQSGEVVAAWPRGTGIHGFVVQTATDTGNAATYSALTPCTKTKYTLDGSPSGSIVHLRVAAVDPTSKSGIGPWSTWAAGTAR